MCAVSALDKEGNLIDPAQLNLRTEEIKFLNLCYTFNIEEPI